MTRDGNVPNSHGVAARIDRKRLDIRRRSGEGNHPRLRASKRSIVVKALALNPANDERAIAADAVSVTCYVSRTKRPQVDHASCGRPPESACSIVGIAE